MKQPAGGNARVAIFVVVVCALMLLGGLAVVGAGVAASQGGIAPQAHAALTPSVSATTASDSSRVASPTPDGVVTRISLGSSGGNNLVYAAGTGKVFAQAYFMPFGAPPIAMDVISTATNTITGSIDENSAGLLIDDMVYDSGKGEVFASNWYGSLIVVNATSDAVVANVSLVSLYGEGNSCLTGGGFLRALAYDSAKSEVWAAVGWCGIAVFSDTNNSLVTTIGLPGNSAPSCLTYDSGMGEIFAVTGQAGGGPGGTVYVYSDSSDSQVAEIQLPYGFSGSGELSSCVTYDSARGEIFVSDGNTNISGADRSAVTIISDKTNSVVANVLTGPVPEGLAYDSAAGIVFVANYGSNYVSAINDTTNTVVANSVTGNRSTDVAFDALNDEIFVSNASLPTAPGVTSSGYVTVISLPLVNNANTISSLGLNSSRTDMEANASVFFNTTLSDWANSSFYTYRYSASNASAGCAFANASGIKCVPTSKGMFDVSVNVTDDLGNSAVATSPTVTVIPALYATFVVSNSTPLLGQTIALVTNASGGLAPYSYSYAGLPPGCVSENVSAIGCLPTQAGFYNMTVTVTDANGYTVTVTTGLRVVFDFNVVVPSSTSVGSLLTIRVNIVQALTSSVTALVPAAGFGTLTYAYSNLPPGCANADVAVLTCTPTQVGLYNVTVTVHDQIGDHNTHVVAVKIVPAPPAPSGFLGLSEDMGYVVVGALVAVAVLVALIVLRRRARSRVSSASKKKTLQLREPKPAASEKPTPSASPPTEKPESEAGLGQGTVAVSQSDWDDMKSRLDKLEKKGP